MGLSLLVGALPWEAGESLIADGPGHEEPRHASQPRPGLRVPVAGTAATATKRARAPCARRGVDVRRPAAAAKQPLVDHL